MTTYYVGPGGSNAANGQSWANRWLTLVYMESQVTAGDTVYVGPGVYREGVTFDHGGSSGSPITIIADVTGENTDGAGGMVRWTGANDTDTARVRNCLSFFDSLSDLGYITIRGFTFDGFGIASSHKAIAISSGGNSTDLSGIIIEDCVFTMPLGVTNAQSHAITIYMFSTSDTITDDIIIRRCIFHHVVGGIRIDGDQDLNNKVLIENCFFSGRREMIYINGAWGILVRNCTFRGADRGVELTNVTTNEETTVYNCVFDATSYALWDAEIIEDYNNLAPDGNSRFSTPAGSNSVSEIVGFRTPLLIEDRAMPWDYFSFASWSQMYDNAGGQSPPSDDLFGVARPTATGKRTWGAIQFCVPERETTTVYGDDAESIKFKDAMWHQFFIPITGNNMTISVQVYREGDYAGTNPQMIIKQPGQSDRTTTDVGSASQWNRLTDTFTPASTPGYIILEIRSDNTATSGNYATFFGGITVK